MKAKEFIKKLNLSTFKGTICVSEKELERHLEEFGKLRVWEFVAKQPGKLMKS